MAIWAIQQSIELFMVKALVKFNGTCQFGQVLPFSQADKFFQRLVNKMFLGSGTTDRMGVARGDNVPIPIAHLDVL